MPYYIISLCPTPDDFTCEGKSTGVQLGLTYHNNPPRTPGQGVPHVNDMPEILSDLKMIIYSLNHENACSI